MFDRANVAYLYDGSFSGMLCCVFESFERRELPMEIRTDDATLFTLRGIITDEAKAQRVLVGAMKKIGPEAVEYIKLAYLTAFEQKETALIRFLRAGFTHGAKIFQMLADDEVMTLVRAVKRLRGEAQKFVQFVRFSEIDGTLVSVIEPENNVLPLIADHFVKRIPQEKFMIYDKGRGAALVYENKQLSVAQIDNYEMPKAEGEEQKYRGLWRAFYNTIEIKQRHNERCRRNFLPKKYWKNMTEFTND